MMVASNYRRNYAGKGPFQPPYDGQGVVGGDGDTSGMFPERNGGGPLENMRSLEQYLSDMMRTGNNTEQMDGRVGGGGGGVAKWNYGGGAEEGISGGNPNANAGGFLLDEVDGGGGMGGPGGGGVGVANISPRGVGGGGVGGVGGGIGPNAGADTGERFSRKVFVGGLPPDIDEEEITASFRRFGPLVVDWPHKAESKSYFPPKGYAFLLFQEEASVQQLIDACIQDDDKLYLCVSSPTIKDKPVQIRPWRLSDADFVLDASMPLDPRKTVFVGGVPRPLKAVELAMIMDRLYGGVCYAGIDTDPELKYPKGAGRVAFSNQQSYIAAISARFVQLQHGDIDKRVSTFKKKETIVI